ncbi:L-lactate MFS transporter [Desulfurella multipotens]|uniref:L-lactate MFS transporter n=1 Tax=Desulfurella multipotens TaxID=79269 RepID=UPI000CBEB763|nr:OFA family MFS transporter [Desulfurella multipotens]PMP66873.1 MAG: MFS transporter [Desulfurella multipotens]
MAQDSVQVGGGRWLYVILGLIVNIMLGAIYSFSLFRVPLEKLWHISATESGYPFMLFLAVFAVAMPIGGNLMQKWGPRNTMILGSILVGIGWILAGLSTGIGMLSLIYGVIGGFGVGLVYGCPIAVAAKWFPDKGGLAIGLTVGGFGLSALVMAPIIKTLIASVGPLNTFLYLGVVFLIINILLSLPFKFPPADFKVASASTPQAQATTAAKDYDRPEAMKQPTFWILWFLYIIGAMAGLMAIGIAAPVGKELKLSTGLAATALQVFALFNFAGRPTFGWLTDKLKPKNAAALSFIVIALATGLLYTSKSIGMYFVAFSLLWFTLGGWLAIAPTATKTFFGTKYYGKNYGVIFTAYGIAAILGMLLSGKIKDMTGSYYSVFPIVMIIAIVGIIVSLALRPPKS